MDESTTMCLVALKIGKKFAVAEVSNSFVMFSPSLQ
jgi:hypothetical protein